MNGPRKSVGRSEEEQKWGFSRISSGGSFSVLGVPAGPHPDVFPPCKITDLHAVKVEEKINLSWTAPGEDYDHGQGRLLVSLLCFYQVAFLITMSGISWVHIVLGALS